jgi:hypothetical protein
LQPKIIQNFRDLWHFDGKLQQRILYVVYYFVGVFQNCQNVAAVFRDQGAFVEKTFDANSQVISAMLIVPDLSQTLLELLDRLAPASCGGGT